MKRGKQRQEAGHRRLAYSVSNRLYADCISVDRFAIRRAKIAPQTEPGMSLNLIALTATIAHNLTMVKLWVP